MLLIRLIHLINSLLSGILGTFGCTCLIWLILTKTGKEMKQYGQVLLQATILDLINAVSTIIVDPIFTVNNGRLYMLAGEFFRFTPLQVRYGITIFWGFMTIVLSNFLSVLFYCRYVVLCKKTMLTRRLYFKLMILPMGSVTIYIVLFIFMLYPTVAEIQQANNDLNSLLNEPGETEIGFGFRISIANGDVADFIIIIYCMSMFVVNYIVVILLTLKIFRYMKSVSNLVAFKTKEMQLQLSKTLFCQAATPFLTLFIPVMFLLVPTILRMDMTISSVFVTMGMPWVPTLNSCMTMWIIKPYRRAIRRIIVKSQIQQSSDIRINSMSKY